MRIWANVLKMLSTQRLTFLFVLNISTRSSISVWHAAAAAARPASTAEATFFRDLTCAASACSAGLLILTVDTLER